MTHNFTVRYGGEPAQLADLYLPDDATDRVGAPLPVVVLVHGGSWQLPYDRAQYLPVVRDLLGRGAAVWNIEYRRVGEPGGGWPGTLQDAADAVDALADLPSRGLPGSSHVPALDLDRVAMVGHSAGGQLVLWLAARGGLPRDAPGAGPRVLPCAVLAQAPSTDLRRATLERVDTQPSGTPASELLIGGPPAEFPERYELASPAERPPYGPDLPVLLVHGDVDTIVPVAFSRAFQAERAELGDDVRLVEYPGVGHFELIDPAHDAWRRTAVDFLAETVFDPA